MGFLTKMDERDHVKYSSKMFYEMCTLKKM